MPRELIEKQYPYRNLKIKTLPEKISKVPTVFIKHKDFPMSEAYSLFFKSIINGYNWIIIGLPAFCFINPHRNYCFGKLIKIRCWIYSLIDFKCLRNFFSTICSNSTENMFRYFKRFGMPSRPADPIITSLSILICFVETSHNATMPLH